MKKLLILLIVPFLFAGCSDEKQPQLYPLNVTTLVDLIGSTPTQVKQSFEAIFISEAPTMSGTEMVYHLPTGDGNFEVRFFFDDNNMLQRAQAMAIIKSKMTPLDYFKAEMEKLNSTYSGKAYTGQCVGASSILFDDRAELWAYANQNSQEVITETWHLKSGEQNGSERVYQTIGGTYNKPSNSILIESSRTVR